MATNKSTAAKSETPKTETPRTVKPELIPANVHDDFESTPGEVIGGSFPPMELAEGEASGNLTYAKDTRIDLKDPTTGEIKKKSVVIAQCEDGRFVGMPIGAIFARNWSEANLSIGSVFRVKRYADTLKKGTTSKMKVFAIKVISRAPAAAE